MNEIENKIEGVKKELGRFDAFFDFDEEDEKECIRLKAELKALEFCKSICDDLENKRAYWEKRTKEEQAEIKKKVEELKRVLYEESSLLIVNHIDWINSKIDKIFKEELGK